MNNLQEQANPVSVFILIIFELDQSQMKFRAFPFPVSVAKSVWSKLPNLKMEIHRKNWEVKHCPVKAVGSLNDLES